MLEFYLHIIFIDGLFASQKKNFDYNNIIENVGIIKIKYNSQKGIDDNNYSQSYFYHNFLQTF